MTIFELGALGEFVGSVAVVVTLIYLAMQIRQNTAQQKREELVSIQNGQNAVIAQLKNPRFMGGYVRTATDRNPSIQDRGSCFSFVVQYLNHFQIVHTFYQNGTGALDEEQYQLWAGFAVAIVVPQGIRRWWDEENGRLGFHRGVRDLIDERLQDTVNPPVSLMEQWPLFFSADDWGAVQESEDINRDQFAGR